jgi:hypothetical protein
MNGFGKVDSNWIEGGTQYDWEGSLFWLNFLMLNGETCIRVRVSRRSDSRVHQVAQLLRFRSLTMKTKVALLILIMVALVSAPSEYTPSPMILVSLTL